MDMIEFGNFISKRRKELGLSQKDLADFLSVSIPTISKWESGDRLIDLSLIGSLAKILKVDIDSLANLEVALNNNYDLENEFDINCFSKYFTYLRKINNYSLVDLSKQLDIRYQTISKWENCESLPNIFTLKKCSEIFNVPLYEIYYGKSFNDNNEVEEVIPNKSKNTISILLSIFSLCVLIISFFIVSFGKDNGNSNSNSYNNQFKDKVVVTYEFNMFLEPIKILVNKGDLLNKYEPNIEGYNLKYYLDDLEFDFERRIYENITLNGIFEIKKFNVTFYSDTYEVIKREIVNYNESATAPKITSNDETLEFYGWSNDYTHVKEDLDIYAIFVNREADITFNANGGICDVKYIYDYDSSMYDDLPVPDKRGYKFLGWYNGDRKFSKNDEIINPIVLTAHYAPIKFIIHLDANGGNIIEAEIKVLFDSEVSLPKPIKENMSFVGWFLNNESIPMNFKYTYDHNIELVALYSEVMDKYSYIEHSTYVELIGYNGNEEDIIIPSLINGKPVTTINEKIYDSNKENIKSIFISNSLENYSNELLKNLINLEKIYLNIVPNESISINKLFGREIPSKFDTVIFLGTGNYHNNLTLFQNVTKKFKIVFKEVVTSFKFEYYKDIVKEIDINLNNTVDNEIQIFEELEKVTIRGSVDVISNGFLHCNKKLKEIILPDQIVEIGVIAFQYCESLETFKIPKKTQIIGKSSFLNCKNLKKIIIPSSLAFVDESTFYNCKSLEEIHYEGTLEEWKNIVFNGSNSNPLCYGGKLYINNIIVEDESIYSEI